MNTDSDLLADAEHAEAWGDHLQAAIDGDASPDELAAIKEHLGCCTDCRTEHRRLRRLDAHLRAELLNRPTTHERFDARLFVRIASLEEEANAAARLREQREYRARVSRLTQQWRELWRVNLGNVLGGATALAAIVGMLTSRAESLTGRTIGLTRALSDAGTNWLSLAAAAAGMALIAGIAVWLIRTGDRRLG